jgi:hypothetical protein
MDRLEIYRMYIQNILKKHALPPLGDEEVEAQTIFDTARDHYQLVHTGWQDDNRLYGCMIHVDIKNGKFWVQYDGTEEGIANELVELGVPKEDIVLAFHAPYKRPFTDFAVA